MKTKFSKSTIEIKGNLTILEFPSNCCVPFEIELKSLKQSKSGVYCLRNKLNGRLYIGMARNLAVRKDRHFNDLMRGIHASKILQSEFDDYFSQFNSVVKSDIDEMFEFEIIIFCYPSQLTFWEGILIDNLKPYYNVKKKKDVFNCGLSDNEVKELLEDGSMLEVNEHLEDCEND
jgi:hypothetical protein